MPSRNVVREDADDQYYHVFNRSVASEIIFKDDYDCRVFLNLLRRYLQRKITKDKKNRPYRNYFGSVELLSFCLMPTHYHLLFYQTEQGMVAEIMRAVADGYTRYFNKKYDRRGPVFTGRYRASRIDSDAYLLQVSRYIHQNPDDNIMDYKWSSLNCFVKDKDINWVRPQRVLSMFSDRKQYMEFVIDRGDMAGRFDELQFWLADGAEMLAGKKDARQ